jgi:hypothetical protein
LNDFKVRRRQMAPEKVDWEQDQPSEPHPFVGLEYRSR